MKPLVDSVHILVCGFVVDTCFNTKAISHMLMSARVFFVLLHAAFQMLSTNVDFKHYE